MRDILYIVYYIEYNSENKPTYFILKQPTKLPDPVFGKIDDFDTLLPVANGYLANTTLFKDSFLANSHLKNSISDITSMGYQKDVCVGELNDILARAYAPIDNNP